VGEVRVGPAYNPLLYALYYLYSGAARLRLGRARGDAPGLPVRVHDAYVAGEGVLNARVLGLVSVVDMRGTGEVAEGELMRFFAEAAWYPTALLPSQGVRWQAVDAKKCAKLALSFVRLDNSITSPSMRAVFSGIR
jgi:hypothetical protein